MKSFLSDALNRFLVIQLITTAFIFITPAAAAQAELFDIVSYQAPKNWKKEVTADKVSYTIVNPANGGYCVIALFRSLPNKLDMQQAFENEWKELVTQRYMVIGDAEFTASDFSDGWKIKSAAVPFQHEKEKAIAIMSLFAKDQTTVSLLVLMNKEEYITDMENFIASMKIDKVPAQTLNTAPQQAPATASSFQFTRSDFDNGWTSTIHEDYVLVEKGDNSVYLLFHLPYDYSMFSGTGLRDAEYYWDNYVTRYFTTNTKQFNDGDAIMKPPYMEGTATDKRTGKPCFVGMYLIIVPNATKIVIGTAPNEQAFRALYPKANDFGQSDLVAMEGYNKFAVSAKDLPGKWQEGNTSTAQWYYTSPAGYEGYAGMTVAATSAEFIFYNNNTYMSIHNGATGAVGNMSTFQQEYKGTYTVSNWMVTATNRYGGKTDNFDAHFVAVKGGRILRLNNNAGLRYSLVRVSQNNQTNASETAPSAGNTINADAKLFGKWNRSGAVHPSYADAASWGTAGYTSSRYEFKQDGSYIFTERSFRMTHPYIIIVKENGSYGVKGNQLTIHPQKSTIQTYNKKNNLDELGSLVETKNRALEKVTYRYQFHYFTGIQEWNLVLQADKPTLRDGNFSSNDSFQNAWYFDQKFTGNDLTSAKCN